MRKCVVKHDVLRGFFLTSRHPPKKYLSNIIPTQREMESKLPQVIRVKDCGTEMINGLYRAISKKVRYGALKYANARYPNIHVRSLVFSLSFSRYRPHTTQLTKEKTRNGKGWILGDPVKKLVYYAVKGDTDIPPMDNWKSHLGKKPSPITKAIHSRRSLEEKRMKDAMKKAKTITSDESNVGFLGKPLTKAQEQRRMVYVLLSLSLFLSSLEQTHTNNTVQVRRDYCDGTDICKGYDCCVAILCGTDGCSRDHITSGT